MRALTLVVDTIAAHPRFPFAAGPVERTRNIGIVIAGHNRDIIRVAQFRQPVGGDIYFQIESQIDQIASDGNVIGRLRQHVGYKFIEYRPMHCTLAVAQPVDITGDTLRGQFAISHTRQWRKVDIGDVSEAKHKARLLDNF